MPLAGQQCSEIIASKPEKTLDVHTINTFIEAIASMFEWGIKEELLTANPAKSLQINSDKQVIDLKEAFTTQEINKGL